MKVKLFFPLIFLSSSSFCFAESFNFPIEYKTYYLNDKPIRFIKNKSKIITISINCGEDYSKEFKGKCLAIAALYKVNNKDIKITDLKGGKNPGSVLCKKSVHGRVVFLKDPYRNTSTFCQFQDGSYLSNDTLSSYGYRNAKK